MARNPLIRKAPKMTGKLTGGHKSAGILDDFSIRKNICTKDGTIEHVPTDDNDIVNKKYVTGGFVPYTGATTDVDLGANSLTVGDGTNYCEIKGDGEINLHGTARVNKSQVIALTSMKRGVGNPPAEGLKDGFVTLDFDDTNEEEVFFKFIAPDDYAIGTDMSMHLMFFVDTAPVAAANVRWCIEWKAIAPGETVDFTGGTGTLCDTHPITTGTPANDALLIECEDITGGAGAIAAEDLMLCRLYRDATHADDTFVGDARLIKAHVHYTADKLGEEL